MEDKTNITTKYAELHTSNRINVHIIWTIYPHEDGGGGGGGGDDDNDEDNNNCNNLQHVCIFKC